MIESNENREFDYLGLTVLFFIFSAPTNSPIHRLVETLPSQIETEPVTETPEERLRKNEHRQDSDECEVCSGVTSRKKTDGIGVPGSNAVLVGCLRCGHNNVKRRVSQGELYLFKIPCPSVPMNLINSAIHYTNVNDIRRANVRGGKFRRRWHR